MLLKRKFIRHLKLEEAKKSQSLFLESYLHINNIDAKRIPPELLCCTSETQYYKLTILQKIEILLLYSMKTKPNPISSSVVINRTFCVNGNFICVLQYGSQ